MSQINSNSKSDQNYDSSYCADIVPYIEKKFYFLIKNWTFPKFTINSKRNQRFKGKQLNPQLHFIVKISTKYHP